MTRSRQSSLLTSGRRCFAALHPGCSSSPDQTSIRWASMNSQSSSHPSPGAVGSPM
jgi:hypothetical protein